MFYLLFARNGGPAPGANRPIPVTTTKAVTRDVPIYLTAVGNVQASNSVLVKVRIDGEIKKIAFSEGQDVKAGDLLAEIDSRVYRAELAAAEAQLAKDQSQLANARRDLDRILNLGKREFASRQSQDTQRTLVAQLEAQVQSDAAKVDAARVQLSFTRIVAPISGRVGARLVDQGNIVRAADSVGLVTIKQIEPINVEFTLPESAFSAVAAAQKGSTEPLTVEVTPRDGGGDPHSGRLILINNEIDKSTGTLLLKARFENTDHALWPGQFINVRLILEIRRGVVTVPAAVVQNGPDGQFAYLVMPDNTVSMRRISVGQNRDGLAVITSGLADADIVVSDGQFRLRPGSTIAAAQPEQTP